MGSRKGYRRNRRRLRREVYLFPLVLIISIIYQYYTQIKLSTTIILPWDDNRNHSDLEMPILPKEQATQSSSSLPELPQVSLKDKNGRLISRKSNLLSQYLVPETTVSTTISSTNGNGTDSHNSNTHNYNYNDNNTNPTDQEIRKDREFLIQLLKDAGITEMTNSELLLLPTWQQIKHLYYNDENNNKSSNDKIGGEPIIIGLETCTRFRQQQQQQQQPNDNNNNTSPRFIGVSGMFNSGSTAFGLSLQANCKFPNHHPFNNNYTNDQIVDVHGMLTQVPWAKHKNARERMDHSIHDEIPKDAVLPIILIRDPYYWMQSMCKQGYGARWDHDSNKHCPNLVPNDFDKRRFKKRYAKNDNNNNASVVVWMGKSRQEGPNWDSLVHLWNDWYGSYFAPFQNTTTTTTTTTSNSSSSFFPRLMIRFEDFLFHGKQVMEQVCHCAGAEIRQPFQYVVDEAKWNHKQAKQNNMISAIIQYGTESRRYHNMTRDDLDYARRMLDNDLMHAFRYKV